MAVVHVGALADSIVGASPASIVGAKCVRSPVRGIFSLGATAALAAALMLAAPAHGAVVDPDFHIVVRTYDASDALKDFAVTFAETAAILEDAGVGVTWVRCDVAFVQRHQPVPEAAGRERARDPVRPTASASRGARAGSGHARRFAG